MFSTLMVRVQTIAQSARAGGPPAARYYGENRSGSSMYMYDKEQHHDQRQERGQDELR